MYLLHHLLRESASRLPRKTAVVFKDQTLSYSELDAASNRVCASLIAQGVGRGDRVGIMLNKSLESIVSIFAILKAGGVYVPLDPAAPPSRLCAIINRCGIEMVVASAATLNNLYAGAEEMPLRKAIVTGDLSSVAPTVVLKSECSSWDEANAGSGSPPAIPQSDAAPAYILHTSGSTGLPKGVVISHLNALSFVNMAAKFFRIDENDRMANHAPLHFDLSIFDIFCAVKTGAALVVAPEFLSAFPVRMADFIEEQKITVWNSVASVLTKLADQGALERHQFRALRLVHFSGDLMPIKYLNVLRQAMPSAEFYNIYGQTEANSSLYFRVPDEIAGEAWKIPIGKPFPNFDVFAVGGDGEVVSEANQEGELHVLSSTVALGYWNDLKKTSEQFTPDPRTPSSHARVYKTGDLVRLDNEGNFVFSGRKDHMVKSKGFRVELDEIEIVLNSHPQIRQAVVVAVPDELTGNRIIAYATLKEGADIEPKQLLTLCGEHLPPYMVPEMVKYRATLPTTSNDKVNRKALVQDFINEQHM